MVEQLLLAGRMDMLFQKVRKVALAILKWPRFIEQNWGMSQGNSKDLTFRQAAKF